MEQSSVLRGSSRLGLRATRLPGEVVFLQLAERQAYTAVSVGTGNWDNHVLTDESFEGLGPSLQDVVVHAFAADLVGLFEYRVVLQGKYGDDDWGPVPPTTNDRLLVETSTAGYAALAVFSDRTRLNKAKVRLVLQVHAQTGGAAGARAELTLGVALRFFAS